MDNKKIPFSLAQNFKLIESKNVEVKKLYKVFKKDSQIFNAINGDSINTPSRLILVSLLMIFLPSIISLFQFLDNP